jgi:LacI family transcriptional regulator
MTGARRPTLRHIAEALGLSVNTVSRALAGKTDISVRTRRLVEAEAQRIGYVPNSLARSLVLGSATTLGLVITTPSNPFYAQLIHGIEVQGRKHGYSVLLLVTDESEEIEQRAVESLLRAAVDGALVVPVQGGADPWDRLAAAGIPLVLVNRDLPGGRHDFVGIDYEQGAYEATAHAVAAGARRIWMLEEDLPITTIAGRVAGFRRAMGEAGLPAPDEAVLSVPTRRDESAALPWQPQESYVVAREVVERPDRPDAVLVGNDYFALGLYRALAERGLRVPEDMMVLGYGDFPFSGFLTPPLTSVRLPAYEVGASAVDLLVERVRDRSAAPAQKRLLRPDLVVRPSSSP